MAARGERFRLRKSSTSVTSTKALTSINGHWPSALDYELVENSLHRRMSVGEGEIHSSIELADIPENPEDQEMHGLWWKLRMQGRIPIAAAPTRKRIRTIDLFCGAGGLAVGLSHLAEEAGVRVITGLAVDTDAGATSVYARNHRTRMTSHQSVTRLVDFRTRGHGLNAEFVYQPELIDEEIASAAAETDLVMAGPPCQGHSNLNNHSRRTDKRNDLYLHVPAFAIACRARSILIENVPSVIHDVNQVVDAAKGLLTAAGYSVVEGVLSASTIGWPQTRRRHFLVARRSDAGPPVPLDKVEAVLTTDPPLTLDWAIGGGQTLSTDRTLHEVPNYSERNRARIQYLFDNDEHNLPDAERPDCHQDGTSYGAVYGRMRSDEPAPTITTGFLTPGRGRFIHPTEPRTLSPAEAARLQGFPDDYEFRPCDGTPPNRSQLEKWIGDAVPMPLAYAAALAALAPDLI